MTETLVLPSCEITSYSINPINNEVISRCGKYTIRRRETSKDIYNIDITINDYPIEYAETIDNTYEQLTNYGFFNMELDGVEYLCRFTSYKASFSDLPFRKNITFSTIGIKKS